MEAPAPPYGGGGASRPTSTPLPPPGRASPFCTPLSSPGASCMPGRQSLLPRLILIPGERPRARGLSPADSRPLSPPRQLALPHSGKEIPLKTTLRRGVNSGESSPPCGPAPSGPPSPPGGAAELAWPPEGRGPCCVHDWRRLALLHRCWSLLEGRNAAFDYNSVLLLYLCLAYTALRHVHYGRPEHPLPGVGVSRPICC